MTGGQYFLKDQTLADRLQDLMGKLDQKSFFESSPWVNVCIRAIAETCAGIPFYAEGKDGTGIESGNDQAWFVDLLKRPNPLQSGFDFLKEAMSLYHNEGCCFWVFEVRNGNKNTWMNAKSNKRPVRIYNIKKSAMQPVFKSGTGQTKSLVGWKMGNTVFELDSVIRFAMTVPGNPLECYSLPSILELSLKTDQKAMAFNQAYFENGGNHSMVVTFPGQLPKDAVEQAEKSYEAKNKGVDKSGKPFFIGNGAEVTFPPGHSMKDADFIEQRKFTREEVFSLFRVPKTFGGIYDDVNYATHLGQTRVFYETVIFTLWEMILSGVNYIFPESNLTPDFSNVEALRVGFGEKIEQAQKLIDKGMPFNEALEYVGLSKTDYDWGKTWWKPFSLEDVRDYKSTPEQAQNTPEPVQEPDNESGDQDVDMPVEENAFNDLFEQKYLDQIHAPKIIIPSKEIVTADQLRKRLSNLKGSGTALKNNRKERLHDGLIRSVFNPAEKIMSKFYLKTIELIHDEVLQNLNQVKPLLPKAIGRTIQKSPVSASDVLFDLEAWKRYLKENGLSVYQDVAVLAFEELETELGELTFGINDPRFAEFMQDKLSKATTIAETMHNDLRETVTNGLTQSATVDELAEKIANQFGLDINRAATIARTESAQAINGSRHLTFKAEGVTKKEWSSAGDERVRPNHVILGGLPEVDIDHNYADDIGKSGQLRYPGDIGGPADEVINCRCVSLAID